MAIYIYASNGELFSWSPGDDDPVASPAELAAQGLNLKKGLHTLDDTHAWDPGTKNVIVVSALKSKPGLLEFWNRFTPGERHSIEGLYQTGPQATRNQIGAFYRYINIGVRVDCNDPYITASIQALESGGAIAAGRAAQILV